MEKTLRGILSAVLVAVVFASLFAAGPAPVQAQAVTEITTAGELSNIRTNLAGSYRLAADIDLSSIGNWAPLGSAATPFAGTLDGAGHTIRNLTIANTQASDQGLFGVITGSVSNLNIEGAHVTAADSAGILAGANRGTLSRVAAHGVVSGANVVGGLVGTNAATGTIANAYAIAAVSGRNTNGGLVGSNSGTLTNVYAASTVSAAVTNTYVQFDGLDDYISIPHNNAYVTDSFTLEAWFQWTAADRSSTEFIVGKGLENFEIHTGGGSGLNGIRFIPVDRDVTEYLDPRAYQDAYNVLQPGWNHVAASWDYKNQQARIFLNGIPQDIYQNGANVGPVASIPLQDDFNNPLGGNVNEFFIGARNDGGPWYYFTGNIADVRFWNVVRTPEQIAADKYKQLTGSEPGLIGYWKLDEDGSAGSTVYDSTPYGNDGTIQGGAIRVDETSTNGGLVAANTGAITGGYYDATVSGLSDDLRGTHLSSAAMKSSGSFTGWDFTNTWKISEGNTYPTLFSIKAPINIASVAPSPAYTGQSYTVTVAAPASYLGLLAGTVTVEDEDGGSCPITLTPGSPSTGSCSLSSTTAGAQTLTATYAGNAVFASSTATRSHTLVDGTAPTVTLNQAAGQSDPTGASPVHFTAVFSEPISLASFTGGDVTLSGTAGATTALITQIAPNDGTTFDVAVSGMTAGGTVIAGIAAGAVQDLASNGNEAFTSDDNTVTFVFGTTTTLTSAPNPSVSGQIVTLTATVAGGAPIGTVEFFDGATSLGMGVLNGSGQATLSTASLGAGAHSFTAVYQGATYYNGSTSATVTQQVLAADTTTGLAVSPASSVYGQPVTYTATVTVSAPGSGTPDGSVQFSEGATILGTVALDGSGKASFTTSALTAGSHSITAFYAGNARMNGSSATDTRPVDQASTATSLTSSAGGANTSYGDEVTFTATVAAVAPGAGTPTGSVEFFDGVTSLGTGTLDGSAQATFIMVNLPAASHTLTAVYLGDGDFSTSTSAALDHTVDKADSATTYVTGKTPTVYGEAVTFTATVTGPIGTPTGTIQFFNGATSQGTVSLLNGQATFTTSTLSVGSHTLTAVYSGDANLNFSSGSVTQTVTKAGTSVTVTSSTGGASTAYGDPVTFTAQVDAVAPSFGFPAGTVEFFDGATSLGTASLSGGQATFTTSALSAGSHTITATYLGSATFNGSSGTLTQGVDQNASTTTVTASPDPSVYGEPVTFTAAVTGPGGTPTGTVQFFIDAAGLPPVTLDGSGEAALTTSSLSVGSHTVDAVYSGDTNLSAGSGTVTQTVDPAATTTTLALSAGAAPSAYGAPVTFTASVAAVAPGAGTPTGSVEFFDGAASLGTATLSGGEADFTTAALSVAAHALTAVYLPDANYTSSTSAVLAHTVSQGSGAVAVVSGKNPSVFGEAVTFTATLSGAGATPTGTVQFFDGADLLATVPLAGGSASLTTSTLAAGTHSITAVYSGDANYEPATSTALDQVVAAAATEITLSDAPDPSLAGEAVTFTYAVTVLPPGVGTPTGDVTVSNGTQSCTGTVASGSCTISLTDTGTTSFTAAYAGDATFAGSASAAVEHTVNQPPALTSPAGATFVVGVSGTFTVTATGYPTPVLAHSGALPSGVTFTDNGDGTATLAGTPAAHTAGSYALTITASSGVSPDAVQTFTLTVESAPVISRINSVPDTGDGQIDENERTNAAIQKLLVVFSKAMDAASAQTLANYTLVRAGSTPVAIDSVAYDAGAHTAILEINGGTALTNGEYTLTLRGKILDTLGAPLGDDFARSFVVDTTAPHKDAVISLADNQALVDGATLSASFSQLQVTFDEDVRNPPGDTDPDDVTNPHNYLLVTPGPNGAFDSLSCQAGLAGDDGQIEVGPVTYANNGGAGPFVASIRLNQGALLDNGSYRFFVCGTTSIVDQAGNPLNGGKDSSISFRILTVSAVQENPQTGFTPGIVTVVPEQPAEKAYHALTDLWIEIPALGLKTTLTGVPLEAEGWDVTWLYKQVGWLEGTAYPTWPGNTVLTAHATTADGLPGPFASLQDLAYGDEIVIHSAGMRYTYAVRTSTTVRPTNTAYLTRHEEQDWLTLITCQQYDEQTRSYRSRRVVRAVLVQVEAD